MFLGPPKFSVRDGGLTVRSLNVLRCGSGWPEAKVLLIEARKELAKRLRVVVLLIDLKLRRKPFLLVRGTCR
jgi:hypothetical protein